MRGSGTAAQRQHLSYIARDNAASEKERGHVYDRFSDEADAKSFEERGIEDRHQFRVIVSPEDAHALEDLKSLTRNLMAEMERDLATRLDWVAADHFDTDNPHTHIVVGGKKDDGTDLVIPKQYVSHGIRARAQEMVTLELGPVSELEARTKIARQVHLGRLTQIDQNLIRQANNQIVDLSIAPTKGIAWRRPLELSRLKVLQRMGLATPEAKGRWKLSSDLEPTLRRLGERGDIIKTMHRIMANTKADIRLDASSIFDPLSGDTAAITGQVIATGISNDIKDQSYAVIEGLDAKITYVDTGPSSVVEGLKAGTIVTINPHNFDPKPSDLTINKIAMEHSGRYSPAIQLQNDPGARPEYIQAHVRRLEALRRAGHVTRHTDGSWSVATDYLERVKEYERSQSHLRPTALTVKSTMPLRTMQSAIGATWLDKNLRDTDDNMSARGFGGEVEIARAERRQFLLKQGILKQLNELVTQNHLDELERRDLSAAGAELSKRLGKTYVPTGQKIAGNYSGAVERPSGKYALIERAKGFSLVPWRGVLERNQGKMVSGIMRGGTVSWKFWKGRMIDQ